MRPSAVLKFVYVLAVAAFIPMAAGFGIAAFYKGPQPPQPSGLERPGPVKPPPDSQPSPADEAARQKQQDEYNKLWEAYNQARIAHSRNVFIIAGAVGVAVMVAGLLLSSAVDSIRSGLVLGGTITAVYGAGQYFPSAPDTTRFIIVTVGLVILLAVGYQRLRERAREAGGEAKG